MASSDKPSIVLLQGSFQVPQVYHEFAEFLRSHGYPVVQPVFPSLVQADPAFSSKTLTDDAHAAEAAISALVTAGKTVLVVMHSYGGLVGGEAIAQSLTTSSRRARNLPGGVAHLVYVVAFVFAAGQTIGAALGESADYDVWDGRFLMRDPAALIYHDLPPEEAARLAAGCVPQSAGVFGTVVERCAFGYCPSTYVICEEDRAVPVGLQEKLAQLAGAERVERIATGHSPMLSQPGEVLAVIERVSAGL